MRRLDITVVERKSDAGHSFGLTACSRAPFCWPSRNQSRTRRVDWSAADEKNNDHLYNSQRPDQDRVDYLPYQRLLTHMRGSVAPAAARPLCILRLCTWNRGEADQWPVACTRSVYPYTVNMCVDAPDAGPGQGLHLGSFAS
jgi:hypothetical protein